MFSRMETGAKTILLAVDDNNGQEELAPGYCG